MSFSLKPTKLLVLSFTVSSSLLFLFIFSILVSHSTPSIPQYSNPDLNASSLVFPPKPVIIQGLTTVTKNFTSTEVKSPIVRDPHNISKGSLDSVGKRLLRNVSEPEAKKIKKKKRSECDVTHGRWVYDESYPLYTNNSCPFIDEGFRCEANGRSDRDYMKWRWQPYDCDLPR